MALTHALPRPLPLEDSRFRASAIRDLLVHARRPDVISLAGGLPADELLPRERIGAAVATSLQAAGIESIQYGLTAGEPRLRGIVAAEIAEQIGVPVTPEHVVITAGSQQALDLTLRLLTRTDRPTRAVMEAPGYLGAIQAMRSVGIEMIPVPVDDGGLDVDHLAEMLHGGTVIDCCYVNPTFQNPTGVSLAPDRGRRLVELAEAFGFIVIADDPYREIHLDHSVASPIPPSRQLIRLGSSSKTLAPGLRVGWATAEPGVIERMVVAKQPVDLHTATLNQLVVSEVMGDADWWTGHLDTVRARYRERRAVLLDAVRCHLPEATLTEQGGGFFLWLDLGEICQDTDALLAAALQPADDAAVAFVPGSAFTGDPGHSNERAPRSTLRLSYSAGQPDRFDAAIRRLARECEAQISRSR